MSADLAVAMKRCTKCGKRKPLDAFSPHPQRRDGSQSQCKACRADYIRERRSTEPLLLQRTLAQRDAYHAAEAVLRARHRAEFDAIYADELAKRGLD